jgi:hypothetical protein
MPITNQDNITAAFVRQFADTFEVACQQKTSRLMGACKDRGNIEGASFTINDMGLVDMVDNPTRFAATNLTIPTAGTRLATMIDCNLFVPIEKIDLPKLKANPQDSYMQNMIAARNRRWDKAIYRGAVDAINRKTVDGETYTSTALPSGQKILAGATTFTKAKILAARRIFQANNVGVEQGEELYMLYDSNMMAQILADTQLTSADFMAVKMLQDGDLAGKWCGFNWIPYELLDNGAGGATERKTVAMTKDAVHFGRGINWDFSIDKRPDMQNLMQLGAQMSVGSGRANEQKIVTIDFLI